MQSSNPRFLEILKVLTRHRVDFIVGGVSAVLHGAPVTTFDLDVVHSRVRENVGRLLAALEELEAIYRAQPERKLRPGEADLASPGHQLLLTKFGLLNLLGMIGKSRSWEALRGCRRQEWHGFEYGEQLNAEVTVSAACPELHIDASS